MVDSTWQNIRGTGVGGLLVGSGRSLLRLNGVHSSNLIETYRKEEVQGANADANVYAEDSGPVL